MQIDGMIINTDIEQIINKLKEDLALHNIYKFAKMYYSGDDLMVCCPYHKDGQERNPSAGIRKSDGMFHCLACGETHTLTELIANCLGYNELTQGYKWLVQNFATTEVQERGRISLNFNRGNNSNLPDISNTKIGEKELDIYRYVHPYMYERGLTDEVIEEFDIGYDKATDSITFPVRDINGDCMFVARRSVKTKHFDIPKGVNKPLYGMYELCQHILIPRGATRHPIIMPDKVYVCEGLFDCLRMWCNWRYAVAGFGCLFTSYQVKQLQDLPCRTIVLALDNDKAGRAATERLRSLITNKIIKTVELPPFKKDIGECTDEEIQNLKEVM